MSTQFTNRQWRLPNNENKAKQSNYSMDFDSASSDYIETSSNVGISGSQPRSMSVWLKGGSANNGKNWPMAVAFGANSANKAMWIGGGGSGAAYWYFGWWSTDLATNIRMDADNDWHLLTSTYDGTTAKGYIDGVEVISGARTINTTDSPLIIGKHLNDATYWDGPIDGVSIFNYALSPSQVTTLYGSSSTGIGNPMSLSPKPVAYYPLGDQDAFNGANYLVPNSSLKDYVFDFDGSNDYIGLGTNILFDSTQGFTFSTWVNLNSYSQSYPSLARIVTDQTDDFIIGLSNANPSGDYRGVNFGSPSQFVRGKTSGDISADFIGTWKHVCLTFDGVDRTALSSYKIYVDGSSVSLVSAGAFGTPSGSVNTLGTGGFSTRDINGSISNAQIFNTALPATGSNSVETLYNNGSPLTSMSGYTSLQGWWKLDASDTYDSSTGNWTIEDHAGSNDGTSSGMTQANLVQSDLSFTSGYSPYALDFDGTNDYIQIPNLSTINTSGNVSISFWMKTSNTTTTQSLVRLQGSTIGFYMYSDGLVRMYGSSTGRLDSSIASNDGEWHLVVGVYGTSAQKLYIDNVVTASDVGFQGTIGTTGGAIGSRYFSSANTLFYGQISNCSVWNTALTSAQVSEIYSEGIPQNLLNHSAASSLVSWWQLGSNSSFNTNWTVLDEKGSNNGTSVNMGEDAIVDGVGSYANGVGTSGLEVIGSAPFSDANSLSVNMDVLDRVTDTPS